MKLVLDYYKAWETENRALLEEVLHKDVFGIRLYDETKLYKKEDILAYFDHTVSPIINSIDVAKEENIVHCSIEFKENKKSINVQAKITIKDNKIYKVYEIVETGKRRIKCTISYDGSAYHGYQKQVNKKTIQGDIESAFSKALKEEIVVHSSGRTDKGVHALNQVIHFDTDSSIEPYGLKKLLNNFLDDNIYIKEVEDAEITFHSRFDVKEKTYLYKINTKEYDVTQRNYEWYCKNLNVDILRKELDSILGTHDFSTFTKATDRNCIRTIYNVDLKQEIEYLYITITGNGFLRFMVRNIVSALVHISKNTQKHTITELLQLKGDNLLQEKAPSSGLYLYKVTY